MMKNALKAITPTTVLHVLQLSAFLIVSADGSSSARAYGSTVFVDTANTYYDGYQQAWRYLGWFVQCENSGGDQGNDDGYQEKKINNYTCQRYLIWAAVSLSWHAALQMLLPHNRHGNMFADSLCMHFSSHVVRFLIVRRRRLPRRRYR